MANTYYPRIIRKLVLAFGNIFNDITLVRYNTDQTEQERLVVPISYGTKELYVNRLQGDPDLEKKVQMTLPRMSFELSGFSYDPSRKQNTNIKNWTATLSQYNPVPYNFDFNLYIYVRNIEDGTQLIEHILPFFTPDYTIKLNLVPEMGISKDIPIVLNSTSQDIQYEGSRDTETRVVIWTLNFTVKGFIFGPTSNVASGLITHSITNIYSALTPDRQVQFTMNPTGGFGIYKPGEVVYQGYSINTASATGKVVSWYGNYLTLVNINGNFTSNLPIKGFNSNANYNYTSYNFITSDIVRIDVTPNPSTANVSSQWKANSVITESK